MCIKRMNLYLHEDFENEIASKCNAKIDAGCRSEVTNQAELLVIWLLDGAVQVN
jgi:hypothetical protein